MGVEQKPMSQPLLGIVIVAALGLIATVATLLGMALVQLGWAG